MLRPIAAAVVLLALAGTGARLGVPAEAAAADSRLRVGSVVLKPCPAEVGGWCGRLRRPLDPASPRGPKIRIGFRWLPASDKDAGDPAIVAVEGGPGYPSIGTRIEYERTFGRLLRTRNLLLVDNRGTGSSAAIDCKGLDSFGGVTSGPDFPGLVADCARSIDRAHRAAGGASVDAPDLFATAYAAEDMAAVLRALRLRKVDLYGDSYGTWFVQSFISRHQNRLNSVILDSAYPVRDLDPWYASSGQVARTAMDAVCARDAGCAAAAPGSATDRLAQLLARLRSAPITGAASNADGTPVAGTVDVRAVVDMVQDAASDPVIYRELDASVRAALGGDDAPLLRLSEQSQTWNHSPHPASVSSNGLYFAVACNDYPQLFSMQSTPADRRSQLADAVARAPDAFAPFTPAEWMTMSAYSEAYQACLDWPRPTRSAPVVPEVAEPLPASIPILVIGGDLDSLTPLSDAQVFGPTLGRSVRVIALPNTVHVTSLGGTTLTAGAACARRIIRGFVRAPRRLASLDASCADAIPPVHTAGAYPVQFAAAAPATLVSGTDPGEDERRAVTVAAGALADATVRRWYSGAATGAGLRGGSFGADGEARVLFLLRDIRFVDDATVDGRGAWEPATGRISGDLVVRRTGAAAVRVKVAWNQRSSAAQATVGSTRLSLPAP